MYIEWDKIEYIKEIFKYIINKIINQEKEGIKILKEDEFSFHLTLYRCFGLLINFFCFNFALKNNCSLINSINYFKLNFFNSKGEINLLVDKILYDYFRFFGFLAGCKNNFFNYYDSLNDYPSIYFNDKKTLKIDFSLIKYLFAITEKSFDINIFLKLSNIENIYSLFYDIFLENKIISKNEDNNKKIKKEKLNDKNNNITKYINENRQSSLFQIINDFNKILNENNNDNNFIMQLSFLFDLIITIMKDDSSLYWNLMRYYEYTISSKAKIELFNFIKKNEYAKKDLENILKEKIIHDIIVMNNLVDIEELKKEIENYLLIFFDENYFNKIMDELTLNKIDGQTKIFYVKDSCLNYLDLNYYISPQDKLDVHKYILKFKKNKIKPYNYYYFNPSKLTFDLFHKTYKKILLNINNLKLIIKLIEKLLSTNINEIKEISINSMKDILLPNILNYLSIFSMINTESFIKFKLENIEYIEYLIKILSDFIKNNKSEDILEIDLKKYIF